MWNATEGVPYRELPVAGRESAFSAGKRDWSRAAATGGWQRKQPGTHHLELRRLSDEHAMGVDVARAIGVDRNVDSRIVVGPRLCAPNGRNAGRHASTLCRGHAAARNVRAARRICPGHVSRRWRATSPLSGHASGRRTARCLWLLWLHTRRICLAAARAARLWRAWL